MVDNIIPEQGVYTHICNMCGNATAASRQVNFCPNCKSEEIQKYEKPGGFGKEPDIGEKLVIARRNPTPHRVVVERTEEGWKHKVQELGHNRWNNKFVDRCELALPVVYQLDSDEDLSNSIEEFDIKSWKEDKEVDN